MSWDELDLFALEPLGGIDPFGGIDALEDDKRRWWPGRAKGFCAAPRAAGRARAHTDGGGRVLEERATLPAADENISSRWGAVVMRMVTSACSAQGLAIRCCTVLSK